MINILIVEDSERKIDRILKLISAYPEIKKENYCICKDIVSSKRALKDKQYDLVILDIQIPIHQNESPKRNGGIDLLQELHTRTIYKKPLYIVGLTEYMEILSEVAPLFVDKLWNIILYDETSSSWRDRLAIKIEYIIESKKCALLDNRYEYDLGIITALICPEFENVLKLSTWQDEKVNGDSTKYYKSKFISKEKSLNVIAACAPQMGMPAAAVTATKLISKFHPKYLALIGMTAGVRKMVNIGDILVADPSWDWGSGKRKAKGNGFVLEPDPLPERIDPYIKAMFQDIRIDHEVFSDIWSRWTDHPKPKEKPILHIGPCASGASVIADGKTIDVIKQHNRKLIGIEMEAYGVMHAAVNSIEPQPLAFSMKVVCDFANGKKNDLYQEYASFLSATLLKQIALKYF